MELQLEAFDSLSLAQMEDIKLMERVDKKFAIPLDILPLILGQLEPVYYIQEIEGRRSFDYVTLYYDTSNYEMYKQHQNGKLNRLKIRTREYVNSNLCFLEIKRRSNKGVTKKIRIINSYPNSIATPDCSSFITSNTPYCPAFLEAKIWCIYKRITLIDKEKTERLTIDYDLSFKNIHTGKNITLPEMVIIELKKGQMTYSPVLSYLNQQRIKPMNISKYCIGVALTECCDAVKTNAIKNKILNLKKITTFEYGEHS